MQNHEVKNTRERDKDIANIMTIQKPKQITEYEYRKQINT